MPKLTLTRPLVIFDTETTGVDPKVDRIVQIAYTKLFPESTGKSPESDNQLFNPDMPIPQEAIDVHGITNTDVADAPRFRDRTLQLREVFFHCDYAGFNVNFDLRMIKEEFKRWGHRLDYEDTASIIECRRLWQILEPRTLSDAVKVFLDLSHDDAHDAMADVIMTHKVMDEQLHRLSEQQCWKHMSPRSIHQFCYPMEPDWIDRGGKFKYIDGVVCFNFGKYLKKSAETQQSQGYLTWMLRNEFSPHVHAICRALIAGESVPSLDEWMAEVLDKDVL